MGDFHNTESFHVLIQRNAASVSGFKGWGVGAERDMSGTRAAGLVSNRSFLLFTVKKTSWAYCNIYIIVAGRNVTYLYINLSMCFLLYRHKVIFI